MEKIEISIPEGLSKQEEALMIGKMLTQKILGTKYCKQIGAGYEINHLETQIIITRNPTEEVTVTKQCNCCETIFDISIGIILYHNYGGLVKTMTICSNECKEFILCHFGDRISEKKRGKYKLNNAFLIPSNYRELVRNASRLSIK